MTGSSFETATTALDEALPLIHSAGAGKSSTFDVIFLLVTTIVGAGVLAFPQAYAKGGWYVASALLLAVAWCTLELGHVLGDTMCMIESRLATTGKSVRRVERYEELCLAAFGPRGELCAGILVNSLLLLVSGAYIILIGQSLDYIINSPLIGYRMCVLLAAAVAIPLGLVDDVTMITKLSIVGVISMVGYAFAIGYAGWEEGSTAQHNAYRDVPESIFDCGLVLSIMFFGFQYQLVAPALRAEMRRPREFPEAVGGAMAICTLVYAACGMLGYYGWGNSVAGNVLKSMKHADGRNMAAGQVLSVAIIAHLFAALAIIMKCVSRAAEAAHARTYSVPIRLAIPTLALCIGLSVPYFFAFLGLISSVLGVFLGCFVPLFCYWALLARERTSEQFTGGKTYASAAMVVRHTIVAVIGLVAMIFGAYSAVEELAAAYHKGLDPERHPTGLLSW